MSKVSTGITPMEQLKAAPFDAAPGVAGGETPSEARRQGCQTGPEPREPLPVRNSTPIIATKDVHIRLAGPSPKLRPKLAAVEVHGAVRSPALSGALRATCQAVLAVTQSSKKRGAA